MIQKLDRWHKTKLGLLVFAVIELAITYGFASVAINRGSPWWYLLTIIFLVGFLQNIVRFVAALLHRPAALRSASKHQKGTRA